MVMRNKSRSTLNCSSSLDTSDMERGMFLRIILLLIVYLLPQISSKESPDVTVIVRGTSLIAATNADFICATIDWWPPQKCDYKQCPWGQASALNLNLQHPVLANAIKWNPRAYAATIKWVGLPFPRAFSPLRIRVGGTLQDQLVYGTGKLASQCKPFTKKAGGFFGFSKGCLSMARWDALNNLFRKTGAVVTFGINALRGRHHTPDRVFKGTWNSTNAREFINYTVSKGYPVDSWEFGNELSGNGIGASVASKQYGHDVIALKSIIKELYANSSTKPLLVAPGGFFDQKWYSELLHASGPGVVDALTHHIYNLGAGDDPNVKNRITDPQYLSQVADTFRDLHLTIKSHGPWASAWVSEAGGAYNSGSKEVSNTFLNSLWYVDQLGLASRYDTKVYCRQTLIGGNYGLLDTNTFVPNPDYYSALLWHRIMGRGVLPIDLSGSLYLRAYAHCRKKKGGIALALINLSRSTKFAVAVGNDINVNVDEGSSKDNSFVHGLKRIVSWVGRKASDGSKTRLEYHLTAQDGNHLSRTMLLNGKILELTKEGNIPFLNHVDVPVNSAISIAPLSIAFVVFSRFEAKACA